MNVFKFGGASLKDAHAIRNTCRIIQEEKQGALLVVVSAIGKTTNALEKILQTHETNQGAEPLITSLRAAHAEIAADLFPSTHPVNQLVHEQFDNLLSVLRLEESYDLKYDQVVSIGELTSSIIVSNYLNHVGVATEFVDAREYIKTDTCFREGKIDWNTTEEKIKTLSGILEKKIVLTQGFIGGTDTGLTTTLGREGSDFSAAIFGSSLQAKSVTIWKDVPGVMSADPKRLPSAIVFPELPFQEAAEMTYYGASVIHPKTIKPLANKNIPLLVKSFDNPSGDGTRIYDCHVDDLAPLIVFKDNQCLISCKVVDYTFVNEHQLSTIFHVLSELDIKINMMQNSAISFSFCIDYREDRVLTLIEKLRNHFEVYYNLGLTLITVKNHDADTFEAYRKKSGILLEQSSRSTLQILIRNQ